MLVLALTAAVGARNISFANYGDGYLQVVAEGVLCTGGGRLRLQRSDDSAAVAGTARSDAQKRVGSYGVFASYDEVVHDSGLFVPEFNTGAGVDRLVSDMWSDWITEGEAEGVYGYKYAPTGMVFARADGSVAANEELMPFLSKLPLDNLATEYNYTMFDLHTREPWRGDTGHSAFPGMLPALHPVLDSTADSPQPLKKQYAVRQCPDATENQCCLVVENGKNNQAVNPAPFPTFAKTKLDTENAVEELKLRWRGRAFHTSYSRGLPDLKTYTKHVDDFMRLYGDNPDDNVVNALKLSLQDAHKLTGQDKDPSNGENELKCRKVDKVGEKSYWAAAWLEHFYTAVVGIEEAGMLRQKTPEYDGDLGNANLKREYEEVEEGNTLDDDIYQNNYLYNFVDDHNCTAQPGGHCGFGYLCNNDRSEDVLQQFPDEGSGVDSVQFPFFRGFCKKGRWRGRPELLRFAGDGVTPAVPAENYTTLSHVLDGEGDDWYNEEFRMSARLVYTGPDESDPSEQGANELPCATTRRDGAYKNVAGDFTRACGKMRATQYEWLVAAMIQTHKYPDNDLHRGADDDGFWWEAERGIGPRPCTSAIKKDKCYMNNRENRVRLWDIDSSWSLNIKEFNYGGAPEDSEYYKNLKALHEIDNVDLHILHYGENEDGTRWSMPSAKETTSHGTSDGTSRTNIHSAACHLPSKVSNADAENDRGAKFNAGCVGCANWNDYFAARATFWPYQWGTLRAINGDVDWTSPAGCDLSFGPPCNYADAIVDKYHAKSREYDWYRGTYHKQGAPGVFGCTEYKDNFGFTRPDWDSFNLAGSRTYATGEHTCSNLMNATHFKLEDLDVEEWDMRAFHRHGWGKRNCAYDDGAAIICTIAAISLNCHNGVSPIDNDHHTFVYENSGAGENSPQMAAKFVNTHRRITAKGEQAIYSPNWGFENDDSVWVNWGKKIENNRKQADLQDGDNLADYHSPYKHGKDDGIVECLRPRDDLLLHSLMKRTWKCTLTKPEQVELLKRLSPCANPKDYHKWRAGLEEGIFMMKVEDDTIEAPKKATGRHYPNSRAQHPCKCLETNGAAPNCNCGLLARTSRLVVGKEGEKNLETSDTPYAPQWVRHDDDGDAGENTWCRPKTGDLHNRGFVPRRACPRENLFKTAFWSGTHTFLKSEVPSVLESEPTTTPFVRRKNAVFSQAELAQMRACVNIEGGDFCNDRLTNLGAAPTVTVKNSQDGNTFAVLFDKSSTATSCDDHLNNLGRADAKSPLRGLVAESYDVSGNNELATGDSHCKMGVESGVDDAPFTKWKLQLNNDFTFEQDTVTNGLGLYEMTKLQQCLEGGKDCPTVDTEKKLRVTIPVSECPVGSVPSIMYRCYEDNDPEAIVIEGKVFMPERTTGSVELDQKILDTYRVRGFEHKMRSRCMDKIQFAIECNGKQELNELNNAVCAANGFDETCQPNLNRLVLRADMCAKPFVHPAELGSPQFFINPGDSVVPFVRQTERQACDCAAYPDQLFSRIIFGAEQTFTPLDEGKAKTECFSSIVYGNQPSAAILFRSKDTSADAEAGYVKFSEFNASVCAPTFREVDLHDYRQNVPMHVYWKHCSALQFHFTIFATETVDGTAVTNKVYADAYDNAAYVAVSQQIATDGGATRFLASLAIPLSVQDRQENEGGTIMWGYDEDLSIRELVPGACRGTQVVVNGDSGRSSSLFTRVVPFDFHPGEPFSEISLGVCANDPGSNVCASQSGPIFFDNLLPNGFTGGLSTPLVTRLVSPQECFLQCKLTANCRTFASFFVDGQERCSLYADVPKLVRLLESDTNRRYDRAPNGQGPTTIETFFNSGVKGGFGTCIDGAAVALTKFREPAPPPPKCASGQTLVPINFGDDDRTQTLRCVRSACNPETEVAIPLVSDYHCDGECADLCTGIHESLSEYTTLRPSLWTADADAVQQLSYDYADTLPLNKNPKFVFVIPGSGRTLKTDTARRLARFNFALPPVKLGNCNPCGVDDNNNPIDCHHTHILPTPMPDGTVDNPDSVAQKLAVGSISIQIYGEDEDTDALYTHTISNHVLVEGQGPGRKEMQHITIGENGPILEDVLLEEYEYVRLEVKVTMESGTLSDSKYALEYNINGEECACDDHHPKREFTDLGNTDAERPEENMLSKSFEGSRVTALNTCVKRVGNDAVDPAATGMPSATLKVCTAPRESPEVCVKRTVCKEKSEYVEDEGSLERDRTCARHPICLDSEYAVKEATPTTARACKAFVQCTDFEKVKQEGTAISDFQCESLGRCSGADEYMNTETKVCATKTDCAVEGKREIQQLSDFADAVCTEYQVVCNEIEYTTAERTLTEEAKCTAFTICEAEEFSLKDATVSSDRTCKPLQKCKTREIYKGPDSFEEDAVCTPIVRFSFAWITSGLVAAGYLLTIFKYSFERFAGDRGWLSS